jgi:hypothetical protein
MHEAMIARSWPRFAARVSLYLGLDPRDGSQRVDRVFGADVSRLDGARVHVSLPPYE